jgi:hypothetical protein
MTTVVSDSSSTGIPDSACLTIAVCEGTVASRFSLWKLGSSAAAAGVCGPSIVVCSVFVANPSGLIVERSCSTCSHDRRPDWVENGSFVLVCGSLRLRAFCSTNCSSRMVLLKFGGVPLWHPQPSSRSHQPSVDLNFSRHSRDTPTCICVSRARNSLAANGSESSGAPVD